MSVSADCINLIELITRRVTSDFMSKNQGKPK